MARCARLLRVPCSRRVAAAFVAIALLGVAPARAQLRPPLAPPENPLTPEKALLGKFLFWDEQLSSDDSMACGTCHVPAIGGGDPRVRRTPGPDGTLFTRDDVFGSPGVIHSDANDLFTPSAGFGLSVQVTPRNAPSFLTGSYFTLNFWDGRAPSQFVDPQTGQVAIVSGGSLESQLVGPPVSSVEMGHDARSWTEIVQKLGYVRPLALSPRLTFDLQVALQSYATYPDLFTLAFGDPAINSERIAFAIASYERSLVPDQTPWDRYIRGDTSAMSPDQVAGYNLFSTSRTSCTICHTMPLFSDGSFHNIGVRPPAEDPGLENTTGKYSDRGRFKTPSLRNSGLRRRFMHDGRFESLLEVIRFYERGGGYPDNLDPMLSPFTLGSQEEAQLLDFVEHALTDPRVALEMPPFDRPLLHSEGEPNPSLYGAANAGSGGFVPVVLAPCPPLLGYDEFKIGVGDALGGSAAFLALAADAAPPGTYWNGIPVNVALSPLPILIPFTLQGAGAGGGYATYFLQIPNDPSLAGEDWCGQWFIADPAAIGGFAATTGVRLEFF